LENPEGWRGQRKNPFCGGVWMFSGTTHCSFVKIISEKIETTNNVVILVHKVAALLKKLRKGYSTHKITSFLVLF